MRLDSGGLAQAHEVRDDWHGATSLGR
jgi:hypothetical protein